MTRVHAFTDDALGDLDAVGVVEALASGAVSIPEVTDAAIARVQAVDPELNGVAFAAFDRARVEAKDPRGGYFAGVPSFVKDNCDVAGMPTQHGCDAFVDKLHPADGDFTRMYRATGVIPLGKSQLSEFGFNASAEHPRLGPVRNPWNSSYTAGASSAGAAALVAAGVVPLAHANDGGGSIRIPASACGLVGLKPTRGRIAQDKLLREMPLKILADGVVTRSVRDTAAFFREAEKVYRDLKLPPIGDITRPGKARLKIALVTRSVVRDCSDEVLDATLKTAALLEGLGHEIVQIEPPIPSSFADDFLLYWSVLASFLVRTGKVKHGRSWDVDKIDNLTRGLDRHLRRNVHKFPLATSRLAATSRVSRKFFKQYDVVLSPTVATNTPQIGVLDPTKSYDEILTSLLDWVAFTPLQNASGDPSISLPLATSADGMPLGMMFSAGAGREATLLELAYELEAAVPFASIQG